MMKVRTVKTQYVSVDLNSPIVAEHITWDEVAAHQKATNKHIQEWLDAGKPTVAAEMKPITKEEFKSRWESNTNE